MKITYRNTFRDYLTYNLYTILRSPVVVVFVLLTLVVGVKPNYEAVISRASHEPLPFQVILFIILELVPLAIGAAVGGLALVLGSISKLNKTMYAETTMTLGSRSIKAHSKYAHTDLQWTALQKLIRTRKYIYLFVAQYGAVVVPRRAFASQHDWDQFWALCQERQKAAQAPDTAAA